MLDKKLILFAALLILLAGVVSANEISDETMADNGGAMEVTQDMSLPQETIGSQREVESNRDNNIGNKTIEKTLKKQYAAGNKEAANTIEVNGYKDLKNAVKTFNEKTGECIIELKSGNYNVTEVLKWNNTRENTKLIIEGNGLTVEKGTEGNCRFLNVTKGSTLELRNITIINFNSTSGGAIYNEGNLTLTNSVFNNNSALWLGGAVYNRYNLTVINSEFKDNIAYKDFGGAIRSNKAFLTINSSTFYNNTAPSGGAVSNDGDISICYCNFTENSADYGGAVGATGNISICYCNFTENSADYGGALNVYRNISICYCNFTSNHAINGGVIRNQGDIHINVSVFMDNKARNYGGAFFNEKGTVILDNSNFTRNTVGIDGGAIHNEDDLHINNSVFMDNKAESYGGAFYSQKGTVVVDNSNFTRNVVGIDGGAISSKNSINVNNSKFTYNEANQGGALITEGAGDVISNCEFTHNSANYVAGAIRNMGNMSIYSSNFTDNNAAHSGAIHHATETLKVYDSNFISNSATVRIGAIYNSAIIFVNNSVFINNRAPRCGALYNNGTADVTNSFFTQNSVTELGGAIFNEVNINVTNSTFYDNTAKNSGPIYRVNGTVNVFSSTFAGNSLDNFVIDGNRINFVNSDDYISVADDVSVYLNFRDKPVYTGPLNKYVVDQGFVISLMVNGSDINTFRDNVFIFAPAECHVYGYDELVNVVDSYNKRNIADCTIHLEQGDYNATDEMLWGNDWSSNRKLSIDGNGLLLDANGIYGFMGVSEGYTLELNNVTLKDYYGLISVITNEGNVSIINSIFTNNSASFYSPIINRGNLFINNSYVYNNTAIYCGGLVYNTGNFTASNSNFTGNLAVMDGGLVYNTGNFTANTSKFTGNIAVRNGAVIYDAGNLIVDNSNFTSNFAFFRGSAIYKEGNGITKVFSSTFTEDNPNDFVIDNHKIKVNNNYMDVGNVTIYLDDDNVPVYEGELDDYEVPLGHKVHLFVNGTDTDTFCENEYLLEPMPYDRYVTNYTELLEAVEAAKSEDNTFSTFYIYLCPGNYTATGNMTWESSKGKTRTLYIEGNQQKLDGNNTCQFMKISQRYSLVLNNLTLTNYSANPGGAILNYGNLSITGSTFDRNNANTGGAIFNTANAIATVLDSNFTNNNATQGGAIYNSGNITLKNIIFYNNSALQAGAIFNSNSKSNVTVFNSTYINNKPQNFVIYNNTLLLYYSDRYITNGIVKVSSKDDMTLIKVDDANPDKFKDNIFIIPKDNGSITCETIPDNWYHDNVTINGKFLDSRDRPVYNATIRITVNGENHTNQTDMDGKFSLIWNANKIGKNTVKLEYIGDYYTTNEAVTEFNTDKQDVKLSIDTIPEVRYHDNVTITGKLLEKNGNPIGNAVINITVNSRKFTAETDSNGLYKLTTATDTMGTNKVTVAYANSTYNENSASATFNVIKQDVSITVDAIRDVRYHDNVTITGKLLEKNGNPIGNAVVNITVNSRKFTAETGSNGLYKLTTATDTMGTNKVTVTYNGNKYYNNNTKTTSFKVIKRETTTKATVTNKMAANTTINIAVQDRSTGQAVNSGNVEVINAITNKVIAKGTLKSGSINITTDTLTGGTYNLTIKFKENTYYKESQCKLNNQKIEKRTTKTTVTTINDIINNIKVKITVTDQITGKKIAGAPITIKLPDGKTVKTKTNNAGEVTQTLTLPAGKNTLNIEYTGSNTYKASTATHTLNVRKLASKVTLTKQTAAVGDTITLTAEVKGTGGLTVNGGKVIFKLNGITLKDSKNRTLYGRVINGRASINYTIPVGYQAKSYNLKASYEGNKYYNSNTTGTVQLTLKQRRATITVTSNDNIKVNGKLNIKITLKDSGDANRKINGYCIIKIDGKTLKDKNNRNIQVKITDNRGEYNYRISNSFNADKHNITVVLVNSSYTKTQASKNFNIVLTNTKIRIGTLKMTTKNTVLKATITDDKGNTVKGNNIVTIKLNGKTLKDARGNNLYYEIRDGNINLTLPINSTGYKKQSYTFEIVMGTNNVYNGTRVTTTLKNTQIKS